jgi:hypothetical protein
MFIGEKIMADPFRKMYAERYKQISLNKHASEKLESFGDNFVWNGLRRRKKMKRGKTIEAMAWQYSVIKNTNRAIVWRNGKFEVVENYNEK